MMVHNVIILQNLFFKECGIVEPGKCTNKLEWKIDAKGLKSSTSFNHQLFAKSTGKKILHTSLDDKTGILKVGYTNQAISQKGGFIYLI